MLNGKFVSYCVKGYLKRGVQFEGDAKVTQELKARRETIEQSLKAPILAIMVLLVRLPKAQINLPLSLFCIAFSVLSKSIYI